MDLGRGAVDFVGQQEVGEDRAFLGGEFLGAGVVNVSADDVGREEVGSELDPSKLRRHGLGQGVDRESFGQTGKPFHEKVVSGEKADQHAVDKVVLANENPGDFLSQRGDESGTGGDFSGKFFWSHRWDFVDYDEIGVKLA